MTNNIKILTALCAGAAIGSMLGVLFAPDRGDETRRKIADNGKRLGGTLKDKMNMGKEKLTTLTNKWSSNSNVAQTADEYGGV